MALVIARYGRDRTGPAESRRIAEERRRPLTHGLSEKVQRSRAYCGTVELPGNSVGQSDVYPFMPLDLTAPYFSTAVSLDLGSLGCLPRMIDTCFQVQVTAPVTKDVLRK